METIHLGLFMLCLGVTRSSSEILQRQRRDWIIDSFSIDEGYRGTFPYVLGKVEVDKSLSFFKLYGQGVDEEPKGILEINSHTGEITVNGPVDYEKFKVLKLKFQALDMRNQNIDTQLGIEVNIVDSNDNPPRFDREIYEASIKESTLQGTVVMIIRAVDMDNEDNKIFDFRIVSVTPKPDGMEFYLTQGSNSETGNILFKGCLDHEKAEKYTIIVEAKDHGQQTQLSSSCTVIISIEDGNNHLPVITQQSGPGRVEEGQENILVSRLQITDKDRKGTEAWKAIYEIHGDTKNNFNITTDLETNEGLLYVVKQLDYEESPQKTLDISVKNIIPYYTCKVVSRSTTGLWEVTTVTMTDAFINQKTIMITVVDINEPPIFDKSNENVQLSENLEAGQHLVTFTARDPDISSSNTFVYTKGHDPANWVTVDQKTGKITTSKIIDRESVFVKDGIYVVTICAVDNGEPAMTSTATLSIHITDVNDNVPSLNESTIDICQSDGPSWAKITAMDLDDEPYSGPFTFKLHGDVEGKWRVDPMRGYSVNLVKENTVHSGQHELLLEVSGLQGETVFHNLSVTVCNCMDTTKPNCRFRKSTASTLGGGALLIVFLSILVLAGMLLLVFLVSCQTPKKPSYEQDSEQYLRQDNTEEPGTDCKVTSDKGNQSKYHWNGTQIKGNSQATKMSVSDKAVNVSSFSTRHPISSGYGMSQTDNPQQRNSWYNSMAFYLGNQEYSQIKTKSQLSSAMKATLSHTSSAHGMSQTEFLHNRNSFYKEKNRTLGGYSEYSDQVNIASHREILLQVLNKMLYTLQAPGEELGDYTPHVYAEEQETERHYDLDAISITDISFDPERDLDLDYKFSTLASICMACKSTQYTVTLIQDESHNTKRNTHTDYTCTYTKF